MEYYGYTGGILCVDLATGKVRRELLDPAIARDFVGGFGVNGRLAYDLIRLGVDPLSPENTIILGAGPLCGTMAPGSSKAVATTKFPINGAIGSTVTGEGLAVMMKYAGYDHVVISGKASSPVYLKIVNDDVEICDASALWGKDVCEATDELQSRYGGRGSTVAIGLAGENLVRWSMSIVDKEATLGRGGFGAVMGSKNLKAVVVEGTKGVVISSRKRFRDIVEGLYHRVRKYPVHEQVVRLGGMANWNVYLKSFLAFGRLGPEKLDRYYGVQVYERTNTGRRACPSCFIGCRDLLRVGEGPFTGLEAHACNYIAVAKVADRLAMEDYKETIKLSDQLSRYGLDAFAFSSMVDFLIELREQGHSLRGGLEALPLRRDFDSMMELAAKISLRQGPAAILADGWDAVLKALGGDVSERAPIVKGVDLVRDPREGTLGTQEFQQILNPRGPHAAPGGGPTYVPGLAKEQLARHGERMGASPEAIERIFDSPLGVNMGRFTCCSEDWTSIFNCLGLCVLSQVNRFYHINTCAELYSAATGVETSAQELMRGAERAWTMYRLLNVREGFGRVEDAIPGVWFEPIRVRGQEASMTDYYKTKCLSRGDIEQWLDDYYDERGWGFRRGYLPGRSSLNWDWEKWQRSLVCLGSDRHQISWEDRLARRSKQLLMHPEKCAGCLCCQLICSLTFTGDFSPARARIMVNRDRTVSFTEECNSCGLCARYCVYGALELSQECTEGSAGTA